MTSGRASGHDEAEVREALWNVLAPALPPWLETRRWFADKGKGIAGFEIEDAHVEPVGDDWLALAIIRVAFRDDEVARYFVPMALTDHIGDAIPVVAAHGNGAFVDATETPWFGHWFIDAMTGGQNQERKAWALAAHPASAEAFASARAQPGTVMRAEQSNTSIRFGNALMVKLVRRLQPGPNPDEEVLRALANVGFPQAPPYRGGAEWRSPSGGRYPIALAQAFIPNQGDGWSWMLLRVADAATGHLAIDGGCSSPEFLLGRRTAELHVALSRIDDPAFAPEAVDGVAVATEERRVRDGVGRTIVLLQENETRLPASLQIALPATLGRLRGLRARADGFREERSTWRIRVHGDFHLGQTLRTLDDDWSLIDFEGEPARPVAERRQKTSALKDVAGMLRSFAYARGTVEQSLNLAEHQNLLPRLAAWELQARQDFLEGYRGGVGDAPMQLVPTADDAFTRALAAWELDKALYEVAYEVRNRPDWIALPLRSLRSDPGQ